MLTTDTVKLTNPVFQTIQNFYNKWESILENKGVLLLVSGGCDSMALLHATLRTIPKSITSLHILTVNYNLRGEESKNDANVVSDFLGRYKSITPFPINCHIESVPDKPTGNLEAWARNIRIKHAKVLCEKYHLKFIVIAHHKDDLIEHYFLKLAKGGAPNALFSFSQTSNKTPWGRGVTLLRPMLSLDKKQISEYAAHEKIVHGHDSSNESNLYSRNILRNEMFPNFETRFPGWKEAIHSSFSYLQGEHLIVQSSMGKWFFRRKNYFLAKPSFYILPNVSQQVLFQQALHSLLPNLRFRKPFIENSFQLFLSKVSHVLFSTDKFELVSTHGLLAVVKKIDVTPPVTVELPKSSEDEVQFHFMGRKYGLKSISAEELLLIERGEVKSLKPSVFVFSVSELGKIKIQPREEGDGIELEIHHSRFSGGTLKSYKKVKEILINKKIPNFIKNRTMVIKKDSKILGLWIPYSDLMGKVRVLAGAPSQEHRVIASSARLEKNEYKFIIYRLR